jgi:hypothetical protein
MVGDKITVVDLVLWRYATLQEDYLRLFPIVYLFENAEGEEPS